MKIHSSLDTLDSVKPAVTIGMFDGVHLGHLHLIDNLNSIADKSGGESVIVTFWPHPRIVLNKDAHLLQLLTTLDEKSMLMGSRGVDHLVVLEFTPALAALSASEFVEKILVKSAAIGHLLMGYNHKFGKEQSANFNDYKSLAHKFGFGITQGEPLVVDGLHCSSSVIRNCLTRGDLATANKLLGYNYSINGNVVTGNRLGRTLGYPTANIDIDNSLKLIPASGVYACNVHLEGRNYKGMLNIGYRPTIGESQEKSSVEVHIFDFNRDIYSETITVELVKRMRDEQKFASLEALTNQLKNDELTIRDFFHGAE